MTSSVYKIHISGLSAGMYKAKHMHFKLALSLLKLTKLWFGKTKHGAPKTRCMQKLQP